MSTSKDYAKPLVAENIILVGDCGNLDLQLRAAQGEALRATIAAAAGEIVGAIEGLRSDVRLGLNRP